MGPVSSAATARGARPNNGPSKTADTMGRRASANMRVPFMRVVVASGAQQDGRPPCSTPATLKRIAFPGRCTSGRCGAGRDAKGEPWLSVRCRSAGVRAASGRARARGAVPGRVPAPASGWAAVVRGSAGLRRGNGAHSSVTCRHHTPRPRQAGPDAAAPRGRAPASPDAQSDAPRRSRGRRRSARAASPAAPTTAPPRPGMAKLRRPPPPPVFGRPGIVPWPGRCPWS